MSRRLTPGWRFRATMAALLFPPLIHLVSMEKIAAGIARSRRPGEPDSTVDDESLAEWVERVLRRLPPPWRRTCLKRAVVLHYLLHRAGRPAELRIGVRRDDTRALVAHAWLSVNGEPYLEQESDHIGSYQVLTSFPGATISRAEESKESTAHPLP